MSEINDVAINSSSINYSLLHNCNINAIGCLNSLEEYLRDLLQHIHSKVDLH